MASARPNVVFVFADQMRFCDTGFMGNEQVRTPHLDQMAAEGVTFTHAVSSCPICTPYRASLLTGKHTLSNGMVLNDVRLPTNERTVAHCFRDAGYDTGYVGKWHLDGAHRVAYTPPGPRRQGFDYWAVANCTHAYMHSHYYRDDPLPIWIPGYDADHFTDLTVQYIREHQERPYCLFLSWGPPHDPCRVMPPEYIIHDAADVKLRPNVSGPDRREEIAGYWSHIAALDRNMGRISAALEETGQAENTIFVFTSDHGDMLGSQGKVRKQKPWDESIRVPFVMRWPGHCPAGTRTDSLLNAMDLMPTLLDLVGLPIPASVEGVSLGHAALTGETAGPESTFIQNTCPFGEPTPEWRGVRTRRHTYVKTLEGPWLLYDNEADPCQMDNLAGRPQAQKLQAELEDHLQVWLKQIGDDFAPREAYWKRFGYTVNERQEVPYEVRQYGYVE
jgi:arylsulfatase A-like enzyme